MGLLEWTDDLEVFLLKGYGNSLNYHMGVPLLSDVIQAMEQAIQAEEGCFLFFSFLLLVYSTTVGGRGSWLGRRSSGVLLDFKLERLSEPK